MPAIPPVAVVSVHPLDWVVLASYLACVVLAGMWFGKFTRSSDDFFFGGQRFSWWLVGISCVATLVGSYSFVQYAQTGFKFGLCSILPYTNEWFVLPLFLVGWLPIVYYNRVQSIPEYFERRFDRRTRMLVLVLMLIYLEGYVSINLLTIGIFMKGLFGGEVIYWAVLMAVLSGLYLHAGGQTSVLMTDLLQGFLLLAVGLAVFLMGIFYLGGFRPFWEGLPPGHRLPFTAFNQSPQLNFVGDFWNDAIVGTFAFYFINQGVLMRFLSARSVRDGRKAMLLVVVVLMPLAAVAVSGAGWVGRAMVAHGQLPVDAADPTAMQELAEIIFVKVTRLICSPGVFGLVVAAVVAALMSTLDTLITAVSAVAINDIWRTARPGREDAYYLKWARRVAIIATVVGIALVPLFEGHFDSIYQALSHFTSTIAPPLVVVIVLGTLWRGLTARAAFWTLAVGSVTIFLSLFDPFYKLITPLAHGIPVNPDAPYTYVRALFGLVVSLGLAVGISTLDPRKQGKDPSGLVLGSLHEAIERFKGGAPNWLAFGRTARLPLVIAEGDGLMLRLPADVMSRLAIEPGDVVHVADARRWLGGFRSLSLKAGAAADGDAAVLSPEAVEQGNLEAQRPVRVEKIL